jgi:putative transposase
LEEALDLNGRPDIFNTDQGSQFTSFDFISVLKENKVRISIDGKDRFLSNYLGEV